MNDYTKGTKTSVKPQETQRRWRGNDLNILEKLPAQLMVQSYSKHRVQDSGALYMPQLVLRDGLEFHIPTPAHSPGDTAHHHGMQSIYISTMSH